MILDNAGEELTVDMPVSLTVNDIQVMADAIRQGLGLGRIFEPVWRQFLDRDAFVPVLEPFWRSYPPLYLYFFPQNSRRAKRVRAMIDFLAEDII